MKLPPDFRVTSAETPDTDLYDMLARSDDYRPEALAAAREELEHRSLPPERIVAEVQAVRQASMAEAAGTCFIGSFVPGPPHPLTLC
jgi:hypothetical protein